MPTKTRMLDQGNFVHRPDVPVSRQFAAYLEGFDRLYALWQQAHDQWSCAPFSAELLERKKKLDAALESFVAPLRNLYTLRAVEQGPTFLPVSQFLAQQRPIGEPFAVLHCDATFPLRTVCQFCDADLRPLEAALREDAPLPWWQKGPLGHPCYLFGDCVWELKAAELSASEKGLRLLFEQAVEQQRQRRDRLQRGFSGPDEGAQAQFIPEKVRVAVWRRLGGRCGQCGGRDGLDFDYLVPAARGGTAVAENLQLLCARCRGRKS